MAISTTPTVWDRLWTQKRRILLEHFADTVVLLVMEGLMALVFEFMGRHVAMAPELIHWVHLITTWTCISTLMLFSIQFLTLTALTSYTDIRVSSSPTEAGQMEPEIQT